MDSGRFDVFLSHHSPDTADVEAIAERLRREGIKPWLDRWHLIPGSIWKSELAKALGASDACAVFVGRHGLGRWVREELDVALDQAVEDSHFRLFMVLLPGAPEPLDNSLAFLRNRTWIDFRAGIDDAEAFHDLICAINGLPRLRALGIERTDICPYQGLDVFDEDDAAFFVGREDDTTRVVEKLKASRFLVVVGPSGSGKSSLVRAGVVPAIRQGVLAGSEAWIIRIFAPGQRPLTTLAAQLASLLPEASMQHTLDQTHTDERTTDLAVSRALAEHSPEHRVVLVVDQFEETFTLCSNEDERKAFIANLTYAATIPGGQTVVVIALRADFYPRCADYRQLAALVDCQFLVSPLGLENLRRVIEEPARQVGLELEAGLAETIVADVADRPGALPLLEHALLELWRARRNTMLTLEAYVASGGVEAALAQRANATYQGLSPTRQELARGALLRLVQPGEGTEDTRRRTTMAELLSHPGQADDLEAAIGAFVDQRLLTTSIDETTNQRVVELAHEALIRAWPELRAWINENRENLRAHRRLTEAANEWDHAKRDNELLHRGARLAAWDERDLKDLNDLERAFLDASRQAIEQQRAAERRRVRLAISILSVALAVISVTAGLAVVQTNRANNQRDRALSRQLAANATTQLSTNLDLSILLALEAYKTSPTKEADTALRQATLQSRSQVTLRGHQGSVINAAFSPDGTRVMSAGIDDTVRVWDWAKAKQRELAVLRGHQDGVNSAAFSPDGTRVVSAGDDTTVRVWPRELCESIEDVVALAQKQVARQLSPEERKTYKSETS